MSKKIRYVTNSIQIRIRWMTWERERIFVWFIACSSNNVVGIMNDFSISKWPKKKRVSMTVKINLTKNGKDTLTRRDGLNSSLSSA